MNQVTTPATEPWLKFFGEDYLRFNSHILTAKRTQAEVEGIQRLLGLQPGARLLDLGCGQGRIAIPLAAAGYLVEGLDRSSTLLGQARQAAAAAGLSIPFLEADARDLRARETYDAIINIGTAFGYVPTEADDLRILEAVAGALKPGGLFLIDVDNLFRKLKYMMPRFWEQMGDVVIYSDSRFDLATGRWQNRLRWTEGGAQRESLLEFRVYAPTELIRLVEASGMVVKQLCGGLDGSPFTVESPRLVLLATKEPTEK